MIKLSSVKSLSIITPFKDRSNLKLLETIRDTYKWAINNDIAKEQARAVLPEGITMSRMYMNGTLRSWIHYIDLRSGHGTQKEHMEVARACADAIKPIYPMILDFVNT